LLYAFATNLAPGKPTNENRYLVMLTPFYLMDHTYLQTSYNNK